MRHFRMPNQQIENLTTFKKQVGTIFKKINKLERSAKNEAINYLRKCIDSDAGCSTSEPPKDPRKRIQTLRKRRPIFPTAKVRVKPSVLICWICNAVKNTRLQLVRHLGTHDTNPVSCIKCRRKFGSIAAYDWHKTQLCQLKVVEKTYKCAECPQEFRFKRSLNIHSEGHKRNNCTYCDMVLTYRKDLIRHMLEVHQIKLETAVHSCKQCEKRYVKKRSLYYHLQQHSPDKFVCMECGSINESLDEHSKHVAKHREQKPFKCSKCLECFARKQQYLYHIKRHNRYKCVTCNETYSSRAYATRHKQKGHDVNGLQARFDCPYCPVAFHRKLALQIHLRKHSDVKSTINCKYCSMTFHSPYKYYKHCMTVSHDKKSPEMMTQLVCEVCGKQFNKKYLLEQHMCRVHNLEKQFMQCPFCDYKTQTKANFERHTQLHVDQESKFVCEVCGKTYASRASLKDHVGYMHSDTKQLQCDQCDKTFKRKSDLVRHARTHSDDRPHECKMCGKAYKRSTHLSRHEETAHNKTAKTRRVQRLKRNEGGDYVPVPTQKEKPQSQAAAEVTLGGVCVVDEEFITVLQAVGDVYFDVGEHF